MRLISATIVALFCGYTATMGGENASFESPSAQELLKSDLLRAPTKYAMPTNCITSDKTTQERGRLFFNELSNEQTIAKKYGFDYPKQKNFGNCVACHQIEHAQGYGNVGPDLSGYKKNVIDTHARTAAWVYQKIADARVDNPHTVMSVNMTGGLLQSDEICSIMSYLFADK